jgi:hypothetical protein
MQCFSRKASNGSAARTIPVRLRLRVNSAKALARCPGEGMVRKEKEGAGWMIF